MVLWYGNPEKLMYWCWYKESQCYIRFEEKQILNNKWPSKFRGETSNKTTLKSATFQWSKSIGKNYLKGLETIFITQTDDHVSSERAGSNFSFRKMRKRKCKSICIPLLFAHRISSCYPYHLKMYWLQR